MPKFIAIFVIIILNSMPMYATLLNDSSMNDTLLDIMRLNNTSLNSTRSDDNWFDRSNLSFELPLNPLSDSIRIVGEESVGVNFPTEETIAEKLIWDMINPPEATIPDPVIYDSTLPDGSYKGGCSEPVCNEEGICYSQCAN